jgi:hypothetical protein
MKIEKYTAEQLLDVIASYYRMIQRSGAEYPAVVLDDIQKSIVHVLNKNGYNGRYKKYMEEAREND